MNKQTNLQEEDKGQIISAQMFLCKRCHTSQQVLFKRKPPLSMKTGKLKLEHHVQGTITDKVEKYKQTLVYTLNKSIMFSTKIRSTLYTIVMFSTKLWLADYSFTLIRIHKYHRLAVRRKTANIRRFPKSNTTNFHLPKYHFIQITHGRSPLD